MLIIAGWFSVAPQERDEHVAAYEDLVRRGRSAPGCLDLAVTADSVEPGRINMFELWESQEHLDAWRAVADPPAQSTEILGGYVQRHEISSSGPPF